MVYKLQYTKDYSLFELHPFNRDVERLEKLTEAMNRHGFIPAYALHVIKRNGNRRLEVKAGHHRLEVAKKLDTGVYYIICDDNATIQELEEATTHWTMKSYLSSFVRSGNSAYKAVKDMHDRTGISISQCANILAGGVATSGNKSKAFRSGTYNVSADTQRADKVADIVAHIKKFNPSIATNSYFINALSRMVHLDEFDVTHFKKKVKSFPYMLAKQPNYQAYSQMIEDIYNRSCKAKVPLAFMADEAAKKRNVITQKVEKKAARELKASNSPKSNTKKAANG